MIAAVKKLLGIGPKTDYKALVAEGAKIIDVRSRGEFSSGHIKGSINIPLNEIATGFKKIKQDTVVITCCASGMRSGAAKSQLRAMGYKQVFNGGGWIGLNNKLK